MTSYSAQFQTAGTASSVDLSLQTDIELSREFGIPISTAFPEDFPGFSADIHVDHLDINARIYYIREDLSKRFPFLNTPALTHTWKEIANTRSAQVTAFIVKTRYESTPRINGFFILKHSTLIFPEQGIVNASKLRTLSIKSPLTWEEVSFLAFEHEKTHIVQKLQKEFQGDDFLSQFRSEWGADATALHEYIIRQSDVSEQNRVINAIIAERSVTGFLYQPPGYWIAPLLKDTFDRPEAREGHFTAEISPVDVWLAYTELRLRTTTLLNGHSNLNGYNSDMLRNAILSFDQNREHEIRDMTLSHALKN